MPYAADYSYARPDPQALVDAGYSVVLRYLGNDARCVTRAELRRLHDVGLKVALIGQTTVARPRQGYPAGTEDADRYNNLAADLDAPDWLPLFYVCDVGGGFPTAADYPAIRRYATGILDVPARPVGQYGPYPVLEMLRDLVSSGRRIECWWQTAGGSGSGWGGTGGGIVTGDGSVRRCSDLVCMFQHYGYPVGTTPEQRAFQSSIDHNDVLMEPVTWAWNPNDTSPIPSPEEDDMPVTTHIWITQPNSDWFLKHGGEPGKQGVFKALNTDQFVRPMFYGEIEGHHNLRDFVVAGGGTSNLVENGEVPDWFFSDRTLLPREWPVTAEVEVTVPSWTPEQIASFTEQLRAAVVAELEQLPQDVVDELAGRLEG